MSYSEIGSDNARPTENSDDQLPCRNGGQPDFLSHEDGHLPRSIPGGVSFQQQRKLIIHVDLNSTILVSDAVTKQGTIATLESFLPTVTWGRVTKQGKWVWMCDSPSLLPPCEGAVSYYSKFGRGAGFTSTPTGHKFKGVLEEHLAMLRWPVGQEVDKELTVRGEDGQLYHWILPSFFQLLQDLVAHRTEFAIIFRTFGTDLPHVLGTMHRVLTQGSHPLFPNLPALKLSVNETPGRIRCNKKGTVLTRADERVSSRDGERGLYQFFSSAQGLGGFQDHFDWWSQNTFSIRGGKPLWIDPFDPKVQHIFIDDNIRQNDEDTIVHPKVFLDPDGTQTRTASISELSDICLVQNDLLKAISDLSYFTKRVQICQENYERNLQQGGVLESSISKPQE